MPIQRPAAKSVAPIKSIILSKNTNFAGTYLQAKFYLDLHSQCAID